MGDKLFASAMLFGGIAVFFLLVFIFYKQGSNAISSREDLFYMSLFVLFGVFMLLGARDLFKED